MSRQWIGGGVILGAILAGMWLGVVAVGRRGAAPDEGGNPYEYRLDAFTDIPASEVAFEEVERIPFADFVPVAVAVGRDDTRLVGGAAGIFSIAAGGGTEPAVVATGLVVRCLAAGQDGTLYAGLVDRVVAVDESGELKEWGSLGESSSLTSIAAGSNAVWVADAGNRVVWRFDLDGRLMGMVGARDLDRGVQGFVLPSSSFDVTAAEDGGVWAVNPGLQRVEHYGADGALLEVWGQPSMGLDGFCGCCNPSHLARLPDGGFVTSEKGIVRIKTHDAKGRYREVVAGPDAFGPEALGLDLAVDSAGRIVVADPDSRSVRVYRRRERSGTL